MDEEATSRRRTIDDLLRDARARLDRLEPRQALTASRRGGLIVDIRSEAQRLEQGLVPDAWFVPRNVLEWRADPTCAHHELLLSAVPGSLVLMCAQGFQSSLAAATLQELGIDQATDMIGGFEAWVAAELPVLAYSQRAPCSRAVRRRDRAGPVGGRLAGLARRARPGGRAGRVGSRGRPRLGCPIAPTGLSLARPSGLRRAPVADPLIGLAITGLILQITWQSWRTIRARPPREASGTG